MEFNSGFKGLNTINW